MQLDYPNKHCPDCGGDKPVTAFPTDRKRKGGLHPYCRECVCARSKAYYAANLEKARAARKAYDEAHKDEKNARTQGYRRADPGRHTALRAAARIRRGDELREAERQKRLADPAPHREKARRHREKNAEKYREKARAHARNNPEQYAARAAERRARQHHATPEWDKDFTKFVMVEARRLAGTREKTFGFAWHVDHIIPLKAKLACGLHVWNNLQVIPATENQRKYNNVQGAPA